METKNTKNILLSCAVILILSCVCLGLIVVSGIGVSLLWPINFRQGNVFTPEPSRTFQAPSAPTTPDERQTEIPESLSDEIETIVMEIETQVSQIRGLQVQESVPRILMTEEELEDIVVNEFFAEYSDEDARQDGLVLSLLGLIPTGFDLKNLYHELYSEQVSGFYDSETQEIYILKGISFGGSQKLTYAHEYTHVLQDQVFDLDEGLNYNEEACEVDSERCAAIQALIEGDASLTEVLWFQTYATRSDYLDIMQSFETLESPVLDAAPPFIQEDLYFPYEQGFTFVEYLYDQGGFDAVDAAYTNPPLSTEQILHPERYPWDQPQTVTLPDLSSVLGRTWSLFDQNIMGELYTYFILGLSYDEAYRLPEDQAKSAAEGWGGDAYAIYLNEDTDEVIFLLDMVWDTAADADQFATAFTNYAGARWSYVGQTIANQPTWQGGEGTVILLHEDERTLWVIAPTDELAEIILLELQ